MSWNYAYTPNTWPLLLTVVLLMALSAHSWGRRSVPGALPFAIGSLFAALWVASSIMEMSALDASTRITWFKLHSVWQLPAITAVFFFVLEYVWPGRWLNRRNIAFLALAPILLLVLILTNDFHHLLWYSYSVNGPVVPAIGPGGWVFILYAYALGILEIALFAWLFLRSPQHRWPLAVMLTGQILARSVYAMKVFNAFQPALPLDALAIAIVFMLYAVALFGFRIFDPVPLARQIAMQQMHAGMLVLDLHGRVSDINPSAERILQLAARSARGQQLKNLLPAYPGEHLAGPGDTEIEFNLGTGNDTRSYTSVVSPLRDWRGLEVGRLVFLRDVTDQKQVQLQLLEQQRALAMLHERERLARELHDGLGQMFAYVNIQAQTIRLLLGRGEVAAAENSIDRLVELAHEADVDIRESIMGLRTALSEQGFVPALVAYLARYEKNYGIQVELVDLETLEERVLDTLVEVQLLRILQEALTNVRKHSGASCVQISFAVQEGWMRVTIEDDGQGFDPQLYTAEVTGHVGLRVMSERAQEVGGSLSLSSPSNQGTIVVVKVPVKLSAVKEDTAQYA